MNNRGTYYPTSELEYGKTDAYLDMLFEFEKNGELTDRATRALHSIVLDLHGRLKGAANRIKVLEDRAA